MSFSVCERCGMTFQCGDTAHACVVEQFMSCQPKFGEWRPIETCPLHVDVLMLTKLGVIQGSYDGEEGESYFWTSIGYYPTHWMPLPDAPKYYQPPRHD